MKQRTWFWIVVGIVGLGLVLRLWKLGGIPQGFYSDEGLYGYEAYSLLKTGKDQFGNPWPLSIAGFGDYRPALYIYATMPFINLFGLTEFATRLPSALFSVATIVSTILFIKLVTKSNKASLFGGLLLSLSPWSIYFGRMAHETNLMTLLIVLGLVFVIRYRNNYFGMASSVLCFAAAFYTYHSARVFLPLFFVLSFWLWKNSLKRNFKQLLVGLVILLFLLLPLLGEFQSEGGWARIRGISIWSDPGVIEKINETRGKLLSLGWTPFLSRMIANKATIFSLVFMNNLLTHFTPQFLLFNGDLNGVYNTPNVGILLWVEVSLAIVGSVYLWVTNRRVGLWVVGSLVLALVPDSLTRVAPSSARIHLALPFLSILTGSGYLFLFRHFRKRIFVIALGIFILVVSNSWWFWYNYLVVRPIERAYAWQTGVKNMILVAQTFEADYEKIWISRSGWGWIHLVFHTKYDPEILQKEIKISERNDMGFWWVSDIGKYHLDWLPQDLNTNTRKLYIAEPEEFPIGTVPVYELIRYGDRKYWFVDSKYL